MCVHGLVFTKAMNTGCGINSDDGLNAFEIRVVRRERRKNSMVQDYASEGVEYWNFLMLCHNKILENNEFFCTLTELRI